MRVTDTERGDKNEIQPQFLNEISALVDDDGIFLCYSILTAYLRHDSVN